MSSGFAVSAFFSGMECFFHDSGRDFSCACCVENGLPFLGEFIGFQFQEWTNLKFVGRFGQVLREQLDPLGAADQLVCIAAAESPAFLAVHVKVAVCFAKKPINLDFHEGASNLKKILQLGVNHLFQLGKALFFLSGEGSCEFNGGRFCLAESRGTSTPALLLASTFNGS